MHFSSPLWGRWHKQRLAAGWQWGKVEAEQALHSQAVKVTGNWADKGSGCGILPLWHPCALRFSLPLCAYGCVTLTHFISFAWSLGVSAASGDLLVWVCSAVFGPNSAACRWDVRFKGANFVHPRSSNMNLLWGINFWGILSGWLCWSSSRVLWLEHATRGWDGLQNRERHLTKNVCDFLCKRGFLTEIPNLSLQNYCCHREETALNSAAAFAPCKGARIHHLFPPDQWQLLLW